MVLVTFRTVQNKVYKKEILPETTIGDTKELFAQQHCQGQASNIKMIFKAKTLQNDTKIGSLNLGAKDFILVHTPKPSSQPLSKPLPTSQPIPVATPLPASQPLPVSKPLPTQPLSPNQPTIPGNIQGPIPTIENSRSNANIEESPEFQENINTLMELGFAKEECEAALRASHGNCETAANYLLTGNIPDHRENNIDQNLLISIHITITSLLIEPRLLENIIEQIEQENPEIRQNPEIILERFGNLPKDRFDLNGIKNHTIQPLSPAEIQRVQIQAAQSIGFIPNLQNQSSQSQNQAQQSQNQSPQSLNMAPQRRTISQEAERMLAELPQEDQDAIHRLQQLGDFPLLEIIQIYQACDRNENQAANILINSF